MPVDEAAAAIAEILFSAGPLRLIHHLENPVRQDWQPLVQHLAFSLKCQLTDFSEWLKLVESQDGLQGGPLFQFFKDDFRHMSSGGVILDTYKSRKVSPTMQRADAVTMELIDKYLLNWKRDGFLSP